MATEQRAPRLRLLMLAGGGLVAAGLILSGVVFADARRGQFSAADRADTAAAVARMDASQTRANQAREKAQTHAYKGY